MQERQLKEDNPSGGVLFYKSKFMVSCTWTGDRTEHTEDEGLGECEQLKLMAEWFNSIN